MKDIYNYEKNITLTKTVNGDVVMTMNEAILTSLMNHIWDAGQHQSDKGFNATAEDTLKLWTALAEKKDNM